MYQFSESMDMLVYVSTKKKWITGTSNISSNIRQ